MIIAKAVNRYRWYLRGIAHKNEIFICIFGIKNTNIFHYFTCEFGTVAEK